MFVSQPDSSDWCVNFGQNVLLTIVILLTVTSIQALHALYRYKIPAQSNIILWAKLSVIWNGESTCQGKTQVLYQLLFYLELGIWAWRKYSQSDYAMRDSFCYSSCGPRAKHLAISNSFGTIFALKTPFCESHYSFMQIQHRRFIAGVAKNLLKALENCSYTTIKQSVVEQEALKPYME